MTKYLDQALIVNDEILNVLAAREARAINDLPPRLRQVGWPGLLPIGPCFTSKGHLGRCTSFRQCYPYFKLPELNNWETWILGMYDTCSYFTGSGRQVRINELTPELAVKNFKYH